MRWTLTTKTTILRRFPLSPSFHAELTRLSGLARILRVIEGQDEYITRFSAVSIARRTAATPPIGSTISWWNTWKAAIWKALSVTQAYRAQQGNLLLALEENKQKKETP